MSNSDTISIGIAANDDSYSVIPTIFSPECDNNNVNDDNIAGSSEALAEGISTMLAGVIRDFDSKAEDASRSQFQLISALDRLTSGNSSIVPLYSPAFRYLCNCIIQNSVVMWLIIIEGLY